MPSPTSPASGCSAMRTRWRRAAASGSRSRRRGCRLCPVRSTLRGRASRPRARATTASTRPLPRAASRLSSSSSPTTRRRPAACSSRCPPTRGRRSRPSSRAQAPSWPGSAPSKRGAEWGYSERVEAGAQPLAQVRRASLSLSSFRRLAWANAVMLVLIVATGATVRLTGSGLGCEHWPGCQPHHFEPKSFHSYVEFSNRVFAFLTILLTLTTFVGAILARLSRRLRWLAFAIFFGTLLQAPLGALTVHYHLNPWLVLSHFLLSVVVLTLGVALAVEVSARPSVRVPLYVRRGSLLVAGAAFVLIVSGTLATAAGPHPGSTVVRRLWSFEPAVYWHVRATAVFGLSFALLLTWLVRHRAPQVRGALVLLGLLAVQMTIGEVQYRTHLPWWLVLVHVTVAATVWAAMTSFVFSLWRPRR